MNLYDCSILLAIKSLEAKLSIYEKQVGCEYESSDIMMAGTLKLKARSWPV